MASFLCPNGTIFSQVALTCDWWFNVKCASTAQLYVLNERLYKYILPQKPSFPEDYAGPLVDRYLTHKFRELEQGKNKTEDSSKETKDPDPSINDDDHQYSLDDVESENKVLRSLSRLIATQ
uniref:Chitin-binding type-2 domain-containing protein n=1 Tax=Lygus hesperus TaxID=30085 RepID=A0A0K8S3F9_LYGHE